MAAAVVLEVRSEGCAVQLRQRQRHGHDKGMAWHGRSQARPCWQGQGRAHRGHIGRKGAPARLSLLAAGLRQEQSSMLKRGWKSMEEM